MLDFAWVITLTRKKKSTTYSEKKVKARITWYVERCTRFVMYKNWHTVFAIKLTPWYKAMLQRIANQQMKHREPVEMSTGTGPSEIPFNPSQNIGALVRFQWVGHNQIGTKWMFFLHEALYN